MAARGVSSCWASRVREHHHREFQAFGLVHGHDPYALDAFLDYRSLVGLPSLGVRFEFLHEGPERGSAALKMPRHVNQTLAIRERLLAIRPKRNPGMRAQSLKERGNGLGDRPIIASNVKESQNVERVGDLDLREIEIGSIDYVCGIETANLDVAVAADLLPKDKERFIGDSEKRPSKRREDLQFVVGPLDCGQSIAKGDDLLSIERPPTRT
jgi:hypothetical protein